MAGGTFEETISKLQFYTSVDVSGI